jgi:demethylmenaquinone methyltransferase/2-methoxy-6-polyprenyl-1,4-benzoquinol methylase
MTLGRDRHWRKETVQIAFRHHPRTILDIGTGTGDLALEVIRWQPSTTVVAIDITPEMMVLGRNKRDGDQIHWVIAEGRHLPFESSSFDATISAFLLRNLPRVDPVLNEQLRVLIPNGRMVSLDTTPLSQSIYKPIMLLYMHLWIPILGRIFAGSFHAYQYLGDSTRKFLSAKQLEKVISEVGFEQVRSVKRMLGVIAIHSGKKPITGE